MSIKIQELLVTLLNDMSQSEGIQQSTRERLIFNENVIADKYNAVLLRNQKIKIVFFLEAIFEVFQTEDTSNRTKAVELSKDYSITGDDLLDALDNEQFQKQFLNLFSSIAASPINREKLQLLLQFCVTNKGNLEDETLTIAVPKEAPSPVIIPQQESSKITIQVRDKNQESLIVENFKGKQDYEDELKKRETNPDSTDDEADLQIQEESDTCFFPPVSMMVLGGFIAAIGIAGIALALTLLVAAPHVVLAAVVFGAVVAIGGIAISGVGFFRHRQQSQPLDNRKMIVIDDDSEDESSYSGSM